MKVWQRSTWTVESNWRTFPDASRPLWITVTWMHYMFLLMFRKVKSLLLVVATHYGPAAALENGWSDLLCCCLCFLFTYLSCFCASASSWRRSKKSYWKVDHKDSEERRQGWSLPSSPTVIFAQQDRIYDCCSDINQNV